MKDDLKNGGPEIRIDDKHKPRDYNKKKRKKGFSEDRAANRQARIGFKNYLRELEEEDLDDELENFDDTDLGE